MIGASLGGHSCSSLVAWSPGRLVAWSPGRLVAWWPGREELQLLEVDGMLNRGEAYDNPNGIAATSPALVLLPWETR
ncbi:MAG TPA: hypothetical protein VGL29_00120 [Blastocatellia bacterium]